MKKLFFILSFALCLRVSAEGVETIRISDAAWRHVSMELISLVLEASLSQYKPYEIKVVQNAVQGRAVIELANERQLDMIWFATSIEREAALLPIRIPIDMGLLGHRVCLIKRGSQKKFEGIKNLDDWLENGLTIGQGTHWPDTKILRANKLPVVASVSYNGLFEMLESERFDCFARSIIEIQEEAQRSQNSNLEIEKKLLFVYPLPSFIFVNKNNIKLAERVIFGLNAIREDGSFQEYMDQHRLNALKDLNIESRHIIHLENPFLSEETKSLLEKKSFWRGI